MVSIAYHSESINLNISVYSTFNLVILYSCTLITFNRRYRILEKTNAFWSVGPLKSLLYLRHDNFPVGFSFVLSPFQYHNALQKAQIQYRLLQRKRNNFHELIIKLDFGIEIYKYK